jgi:lipopolysaccharide export system protein LptC
VRPGGAYSRFANAMRIALPVIAGAIMILVIAWPQLVEQPKRFSLGVSKVTINDSGGQQIVNARFTGTDRDDRPFTITADTASQPVKTPGVIDLAFPKADVAQENGSWVALSAETGLYDKNAQVLDLKGGVNLFHDTGYELRTATARVELDKGEASGVDPVSGQGPFGTLNSSGFRILDRGKRLIFTGKSRLVLFPAGKDGKG